MTSDSPFSGLVAVVTGASRNIGAAITHTLVAGGCHVYAVARNRDALEAVAGAVPGHERGHVTPVVADLATREGTAQVIERIDGAERIDILINNAHSGGVDGPLLEQRWEQWQPRLEVNVRAPFELSLAAARRMQQAEGGRIVNLLTTAAFHPVAEAVSYGSSKAALWMLTRYMAVALAPSVRVNAVVPGTVAYPDDPRMERFSRPGLRSPLGRVGAPQEIADAVAYLASDQSTYITGQAVFVDGGWSIRPAAGDP